MNQGHQICISGALGLPDDCASGLEGRQVCAALRVRPAEPPASSYEAVRLVAAGIRTVWTDEQTTPAGEQAEWFDLDTHPLLRLLAEIPDYYSFEFDAEDIEVCGDFCSLTNDHAKVFAVLDAAYCRAGGQQR